MTEKEIDWDALMPELIEEYGSIDNIPSREVARRLGVSGTTVSKHKKKWKRMSTEPDEEEDVSPQVQDEDGDIPAEVRSLDPFSDTYGPLKRIVESEGYREGSREYEEKMLLYGRYIAQKKERMTMERNPLLKDWKEGEERMNTVIKSVSEFLKTTGIPVEELVRRITNGRVDPSVVMAERQQAPVQTPPTQGNVIGKQAAIRVIEDFGGIALFGNKEPNKKILANMIRGYGWVLLDSEDARTVREAAGALANAGYKVVNLDDETDMSALLLVLRSKGYMIWNTNEDDWIEKLGRELKKDDKRIMDIEEYRKDVERAALEKQKEGISEQAAIEFLTEKGYEVEKATLTKAEIAERLKQYREQWEKEFDLKLAKETEEKKMEQFGGMIENVVGTLFSSLFGAPQTKEEEEVIEKAKEVSMDDLRKAKEELEKRKKAKKKGGKK